MDKSPIKLERGCSSPFWLAVLSTVATWQSGIAFSVPVSVATLEAMPSAVTNVKVLVWGTTAKVSWLPAKADVGKTSIRYSVQSDPEGVQCSTSSTSCTVAGLVMGQSYTFWISGTNSQGSSGVSVASAATTIPVFTPSKPNPPMSLSVSSKATSLVVAWDVRAGGHEQAPDRFNVTASPGKASCTTVERTCSISGLDRGVTYTVEVVASNAAGSGFPSSASARIPAIAPPVPRSLRAYPTSTGAVVSWTPVMNTGAPVSYAVTSMPASAGCVTTSSSCVINGLKPAKSYRFTITASNKVGKGKRSGLSWSVYPGKANCAPKDGKYAGRNLTGCDFAYRKLTNIDFTGANLTDVNLVMANLGGSKLRDAGKFRLKNLGLARHVRVNDADCGVSVGGSFYCVKQMARPPIVAPLILPGFSVKLTQVSTSGSRLCAVTTRHTVLCVQNVDQTWKPLPVAPGLGPAARVSVSDTHVCVVSKSGKLSCWMPRNDGWQDGGGTRVSAGLGIVKDVVASLWSTCALRADSTVRCWGGLPASIVTDNPFAAMDVSPPTDLGQVKSLYSNGRGIRFCAVKLDGNALCWGKQRWSGQEWEHAPDVPNDVPKLESMSLGALIDCGIDSAAIGRCWAYESSSLQSKIALLGEIPGVREIVAWKVGDADGCIRWVSISGDVQTWRSWASSGWDTCGESASSWLKSDTVILQEQPSTPPPGWAMKPFQIFLKPGS